MAKKQKNARKGHLGLAETRSRIIYNLQSRDIRNKRNKLERHKKRHPEDSVNVESVMSKYITNRKPGKRTSL